MHHLLRKWLPIRLARQDSIKYAKNVYPIYKQFAISCITRTIAQMKNIFFFFILLNKMHITFYQKQSHGEHDILAELHFSCVISCNIRVFKHNHSDNMSKRKSNHFLSFKAKEIIFKNTQTRPNNQIIIYDRE